MIGIIVFSLLFAINAYAQCPSNTFTCTDGSCIPQDWRGDGERDCDDGSDEIPGATTTVGSIPTTTTTTIPSTAVLSCSNHDRDLVTQCSSAVDAWMSQLDAAMRPTAIGFFTDKTSWPIAEQACTVFPVYRQCLRATPSACQSTSTSGMWQSLETYICELLLPTVRDHHQSCFSRFTSATCPKSRRILSTPTPICKLMLSVYRHLDCIDSISADCDQSTRDMIDPLRTDTNTFDSQFTCTTVINDTTSIDDETDDVFEELPIITAAVTPTIDDNTVITSNLFHLLRRLPTICRSSSSHGFWQPTIDILCTDTGAIPNVDCFRADDRCNTTSHTESVCSAVASFNHFIDCAITTVNDECPIDAQNYLVSIQEKLSDLEIAHKCYDSTDDDENAAEIDDGTVFHVHPSNARCTSEQENVAVVCLVELLELQKHLGLLQTRNLLVELSEQNSTILASVCSVYTKYEKCLDASVFVRNGGRRCSFNSPLNTLARVGLGPICGAYDRRQFVPDHDCIAGLSAAHRLDVCGGDLQRLSTILRQMLQGGGGTAEVLLCRAFYLIRDLFGCVEPTMRDGCGETAVANLLAVKASVTALGVEEGCPAERPEGFDAVVITTTITNAPPSVDAIDDIKSAPIARPIPSAAGAASHICEPEEHQRFTVCIEPLTSMQPHPLTVIRQPRLIADACLKFAQFLDCRTNLWSQGMVAMFRYACGTGKEEYLKVRQCIRKVSTRPDLRDCVSVFSKGAPVEACRSSVDLLACVQPTITDKCGETATHFIAAYITEFAHAIDPKCTMNKSNSIDAADDTVVRTISTFNCTSEQASLVEQCAAPMKNVSAQLDELFKGGLQTFLANMNQLPPIFANGCELSGRFLQCAQSVIDDETTQCRVSSCLIKAGDGICNETDTAGAIDRNLNCIFAQIQDPIFGKCLRETIATLKEFTLHTFRVMLPRFVACVEHIVVARCGATPLNVLKAISSTSACIISKHQQSPMMVAEQVTPTVITCTDSLRLIYNSCIADRLRSYTFMPLALLSDATAIDRACNDSQHLFATCDSARVCHDAMATSGELAMVRMLDHVCTRVDQFRSVSGCLGAVASAPEAQHCLAMYLSADSEHLCDALTNSANCLASAAQKRCGDAALALSYSAMSEYAQQLNATCTLSVPTVALQTGCSEDDLIDYLQCETAIDPFEVQPISLIANASLLVDFCTAFNGKYRGCIDAMRCRFEPVSTANIALFDSVCNRPLSTLARHIDCLVEYTASDEGKSCAASFGDIDFLAPDAASRVCNTFNQILGCASHAIDQRCGIDSVLAVFDLHTTWAHGFNRSCAIVPPDLPVPTSVPVSEPERAPVGKPEPQPITKPESQPESTSKAEPEPEPTSKPEPEPEPTSKTEPTPESQPEPTSKAEPEPEPTSKPEPTSNAEPEPKPESTSEPEPEPTRSPSTITTDDDRSLQSVTSVQPEPEPKVEPSSLPPSKSIETNAVAHESSTGTWSTSSILWTLLIPLIVVVVDAR